MSELVWGIKNGDLEQVRDIVEKKANIWNVKSSFSSIAFWLPLLRNVIKRYRFMMFNIEFIEFYIVQNI